MAQTRYTHTHTIYIYKFTDEVTNVEMIRKKKMMKKKVMRPAPDVKMTKTSTTTVSLTWMLWWVGMKKTQTQKQTNRLAC